MTEYIHHNLEPYKKALAEMGFTTMADLYKAMQDIPLADQKISLEAESDEYKRMLLTNTYDHLSMGEYGRGK